MAPATSRADAVRLLGIAEKLLAGGDLVGSRGFALQALDAEPLLDGVDQVIAVADVLLAAEKRVNNHHDWYAVLKLDTSAGGAVDADAIRKKYRKLALLLHPDKNGAAGADAAFKLVLDAWSVLSDPTKRALYDKEREMAIRLYSGGGRRRATRSQTKASAKAPPPGLENFWTGCPFCFFMYEYARDYESCNLKCQTCKRPFKAMEVKNLPQIAPGMNAYYCNWGFFPFGSPGFNPGNPSNSSPNPYMGMGVGGGQGGSPFFPMFPGSFHPEEASVPPKADPLGGSANGSDQTAKPASRKKTKATKAKKSEKSKTPPSKVQTSEILQTPPSKPKDHSVRPNVKQRVVASQVRHSPRLEKLKQEMGVCLPSYEEMEEEPGPRGKRKKVVKGTMSPSGKPVTRQPKENVPLNMENGGLGGSGINLEEPPPVAAAENTSTPLQNPGNSWPNMQTGNVDTLSNDRSQENQNGHLDSTVLGQGMLDPDISDILRTLPKIYDVKGEEVELNLSDFRF